MINVSAYPFCATRLKWNFTQLTDPIMSKYWAAVIVADWCEDEDLTKFGGFDFNDRSDGNGEKLLGCLEQFLRVGKGKKAKSDVNGMPEAEISVRAFLGANGVKVGRLKTLDDYWTAATTLWPAHIEASPKVRDVYTLRFQISKISKKQRSKQARANRANLPTEWCTGGAK